MKFKTNEEAYRYLETELKKKLDEIVNQIREGERYGNNYRSGN